MNINELTIGQAKELVAMFPKVSIPAMQEQDFGLCIVVLDRGYIYAGNARRDGNLLRIDDSVNIRYWGTTRGLGQLALEGPTDKTKVDKAGNIFVPYTEVKHLIEIKAVEKWNSLSQ